MLFDTQFRIFAVPFYSFIVSFRSLIKLCQMVYTSLTTLLDRFPMPILGCLKIFFQTIGSQTVIVSQTILCVRISLLGSNGDLFYCDGFQYIGSIIRSVI